MEQGKKIAILQSNYIPWKGYFDIIGMVDEFILYDDVQYTKNDWRNRNKIKTANGVQWITIPVKQEQLNQKINETKVADSTWNRKNWSSLVCNYSKAGCFKMYKDVLEELYMGCREQYLSEINYRFIMAVNQILGIKTKISWSSDYPKMGDKSERLVQLVKSAGGSEYLSGPSARNYIREEIFTEAGIKLSWMEYSGYPEYKQLYPPFEHGVSILDLILNEGPDAANFMKFSKAGN